MTTILGMSTATYTLIHVLISLVGIASGFVVVYGLLGGKRLDRWTAIFLTTTVLTSVTGFGFPIGDHRLAPDLRYQRRDCAVSQHICPGGAVVRKGASPEGAGSHAEGSALRGRATGCDGDFRGADDFCGQAVPQSASCGL